MKSDYNGQKIKALLSAVPFCIIEITRVTMPVKKYKNLDEFYTTISLKKCKKIKEIIVYHPLKYNSFFGEISYRIFVYCSFSLFTAS